MTKKDLFRILIKLLATYSLIITVFTTIPSSISYLPMYSDDLIFMIGWIIGSLLIVGGLFLWLLRKPDGIINLLKLDKGFDDELIDLKIAKPELVLHIGLIVIGGIMFVDNILLFITYTYTAFQADIDGNMMGEWDKQWWVVSALKTFVGYLLVWNYAPITTWILKRQVVDTEQR